MCTGGRACAPSAPSTAYAAGSRRRSAATLSVTHLGCTIDSPAASPYRHLGVDTYPGVTTIVCKTPADGVPITTLGSIITIFQADRAVAKTKELKRRYGAKRRTVSSVLEAVSRASGSPFSAALLSARLSFRAQTWNWTWIARDGDEDALRDG